MMNNLQEFIDLLKSEKEKAVTQPNNFTKYGDVKAAQHCAGLIAAFSFAIANAELLLKTHTGAITKPPHFANTMLSERAANADTSKNNDPVGVLGETPAVKQNEQTKEVVKCDLCTTPKRCKDSGRCLAWTKVC